MTKNATPSKPTLAEELHAFTGVPELPVNFCQDLLERLKVFHVKPKKNDLWQLGFSSRKTVEELCGLCNLRVLPPGLYSSAVDRICGEFLAVRFQLGDSLGEATSSPTVSSVKTGDSTVSFAVDTSTTQEARQLALVTALRNSGKELIPCYRKLRW